MRYTQTREQSAELLRLVLARMGEHDATFTPVTFTVWFEYAAGMNGRLSQALDRMLQSKPRLNDADIWTLHQSFVADVDPQAMQRIGGDLQRVMISMVEAAARTGDNAGTFDAQLQALANDLQRADGALALPALTQAIEGTAQMRSSAQALESDVKASRAEIERLQGELTRVRDESLTDMLTRVLNRKGFELKLADLLAAPEQPDRVHGLIMFDIDHFKNVNDTRGHVMGDRVLQALGEVLKSCVPSNSGVAVARYGGEEFAMLVPHGTQQQCLELAELARTRVKALKIRDRRTQEVVLTVTMSGGVAYRQPGDDAQALVTRADTALYQSKQSGRDRVSVL